VTVDTAMQCYIRVRTGRSLYRRDMSAGILWAALLSVDLAAGRQSPDLPCPSPADLDAELVRMGAVGITPPEIAVTGDRMRVVLRGRDGAPVGTREVQAPASCHERATVAAVLVVTWMGIWPEAPKGASAPPAHTSTAPAPGATQRKTEIGLAINGAYDGNPLAFGFAVEARRRLLGPVFAWVGLTSTTERDQRVGPAQGGYTRPALEAGPAVRFGRGWVRADVAASARLGILIVRGIDLSVAHVRAHAVPGAAANLRLVIAQGRFSPFLAAGACYWFGRQQLTLDDNSATAYVPGWDVAVGLGVFWAP
jgi:hypothetical protein